MNELITEYENKILIVDDKPENLSLLFNLLQEHYEVLAAEDGDVALEITRENRPDLILLDIMMPEINGFEVCRLLKADPETSDIPIIFMSALNDTESKIKGFEYGAVDYITKPVQNEEALSRIRTQLRLKNYQKQIVKLNKQLEKKVSERTNLLEEKVYEINKYYAALKESEARYKTLFEDAPDAILLIDVDSGIVVDANPAAYHLFGITEGELIGIEQDEIFINKPENIEKNVDVAEDLMSFGGKPNLVFQNIIINRLGKHIPVEVSAKTILVEGQLLLQGVIRDITERKLVEDKLRVAKEKAEEMNRVKSNFLSNMNHELRTPLIGIMGFAEFMKEELEQEEFRNMASIIYKGGERLLRTLNLILDISAIEHGKVTLNRQIRDIRELLEKSISEQTEAAKGKNITLIKNFSDQEIKLNIDCRMFKNLIDNLISNAIKYTDKGHIEIKTELIEDETSWANIKIIDTGIGIDRERLELIFSDFRQGSEGMSRDYEGTGLGLSLSQKFIEFMGGMMTVDSVPGKGSVFNVIMPVTEDIQELDTKKLIAGIKNLKLSGIIEGDSKKGNILIFDNDYTSREYIKIILDGKYEMDDTSSVKHAIEMVREKNYDILLIDVDNRIGLGGEKLLSLLQGMAYTENIAKIAMTSVDRSGDEEKLLNMGFTDYIVKPFDKKKLLKLLRSASLKRNKG